MKTKMGLQILIWIEKFQDSVCHFFFRFCHVFRCPWTRPCSLGPKLKMELVIFNFQNMFNLVNFAWWGHDLYAYVETLNNISISFNQYQYNVFKRTFRPISLGRLNHISRILSIGHLIYGAKYCKRKRLFVIIKLDLHGCSMHLIHWSTN